jgi:hypothetical protein
MRIPVIRGIIDRRILVNFRIDPAVLRTVLPAPFRPKLVNGVAMGGMCLIRVKDVRPRLLPAFVGVSSENAALRFSVEWDAGGQVREGVYIPRRLTNSRLNALVGGRFFPGVHDHARFQVEESDPDYSVTIDSDDGKTHLAVKGRVAAELPASSVFGSLEEASNFFKGGSLGYSDTDTAGTYDGLELRSFNWEVQPLAIEHAESSVLSDRSVFPEGSVEFECALLMRQIEHEWHGRESLCACEPALVA